MGKFYTLLLTLLIAFGSIFASTPSGYEWWFDNDVSSVGSGSLINGQLELQIDASELPRGSHYFNCRLNDNEGDWGSIYRKMFYALGTEQGAIGYEYWFDSDYSERVSGDISSGSNSFDIDLSSLSAGTHYFNCRLKSNDKEYGTVYRKMFYSVNNTVGAVAYEYWFDNDHNSKSTGIISEGSMSFDIDLSNMSPGAHYFNCRLFTNQGGWGSVYRKMILVLNNSIDAVAYEYWIDDDYSNRIEGAFNGDGDNSYDIDLSGIKRGIHRFCYRICNGSGLWGSVYTHYFYSSTDESKFSGYEYWLDDDFEHRVYANSTGNTVLFDVDLSGFDKSHGLHFFNLRTCDEDKKWSPVYRKVITFTDGHTRSPIIGYRHYINGSDLGYVEVERQFVDSYMFDINLPDSLYPSVKNRRPIFDGDKVSVADAHSVDYIMQIRTELGWSVPQEWRMELKNDFSTTAVEMKVNTKQTFVSPSGLEFAAVKFTSSGNPLYFRSDIPVALDIYKEGDRVEAIAPAQLKGMTMLQLEEGEYFGILYGVEDSEAKNFTLHLMDTPNIVPMPEISFEDGMVTMTCSRSDAEIRYTLDESEPTEESQLYTEAFALSRNATVKAKAFVSGSDIEPSIVAELVVDSYKTATPTGVFDVEARQLTLTCATEGASLSYTFDREGEWTAYTVPIAITRNCTVYAMASFLGYNDSEIAEIAITELANSVADPEISFANGLVTITCENSEAEIHYTLDGSEPTAESPKYTEPFSLSVNGVVKAFAFIPGLDIPTSNVSQLIVDSYKTATPTGVFDVEARQLTLTCATEGASLSYTFDREGEWTAYTAPITITRNCTVYAMASFPGYNDSEIVEIAITELANSVADPEISFANGLVTITCENSEAEIHYTVDGSEPTAESPKYTEPFSLAVNGVVKAFAFIPGLDIPTSNVSQLLVDSYKTATPTGVFDVEARQLTLTCATEGASLSYTFDREREWTAYTAPIAITRNCTVYAMASFPGYNDSEIAEIAITELANSVPDPEISFESGLVTITCENSDAEIHYTLDGSEPTAESPIYTEPFSLAVNGVVKAFAFIPGLDIPTSNVSQLIVDSYKTATPTGVFDVEARQLTLTCATEGASLSYTFDREREWTAYTAPIAITRNCTVYAMASFPGYNDSEIAEIAITELANSVADPEISFESGLVTITCENSDAEIHYTLDGSEPTAESPKYTEPFSLAVNGVVKAFAFIPGLDIPTSNVSQLIVDSYKAAIPTGVFDMPSRTMTLSCSTAGAAISYRIGVAGEWTDYTGPFNIGRNITVYAKASLEGYNDSDVAEIAVTGFPDSMPQPIISFSDGKVTITCERSDALIRYTLDKTAPTMESTLYEGPFALSHNATIWAIAYIPNSDIEPSEISELVVDSYQTATPTGNFDYESGKLTLQCATEGAAISYALNAPENWIVYESPIEISGNCTVYAKASAEGYNESEMLVMEIGQFRCCPVDISYNGRFVTLKTEDPQAEIRYSVILPDGVVTVENALYTGKIDVQTLCHVSAKAVREGYQDSEVSVYSVNCYGDENHVETNAGGLLASSFEWCGSELLNGISEFKVEGILNDDDYSFLKSMQGLRHLDIYRVSDARIPANAFKGSRLISISLPADITEYGDSILSDSQDLCSVIWNSDSKNVDGALINGIANPNALIYVPVGVSVEDSSGLNIVEGNSASSIILHDGFPFYVAREFTAANISYTRNFEMNTFFDISAGWETIVLPFAPESITHETAGEIVPFAAWNGDTSGGPKPFWLYRSDSDGWKEADCIEAGVPYIISMPNNADYVASFNLNGKVTFSGARVQLTPETNLLDATPWVNGTMFEGTFLRVEEDGLLSLNVHSKEEGIYPGSAFVDDDVTAPFGAYVRHAGSRKFMPLFGNYNAVQYPSLGAGLTIVSPAPGLLSVSSNRECKVDVVTATGVRIHTFHLMPGETQTLEGLTRDLYIVAGRKVMVK